MDNKSKQVISEDVVSVGVVLEPIANTGLTEGCFKAATEPEVVVDSTLCKSVLGHTHDDFQ